MTLLAAVGVARSLSRVCGLNPEIKWPNDILIGQKKIAGILTEMEGQDDRIAFVVLGIGLNVHSRLKELPEGATSVREEVGERVSRVVLARALLSELDDLYGQSLREGFEKILTEWRQRSQTLGRRVSVQCSGRQVEGQAMDIDATGALLIRNDQGFIEPIHAGDILLIR